MNDLAIIQNDDGWGDAAAENAERVIKGTLLKFSDWRWTKGKEGTEVKEGTTLVALGTSAAWVKWHNGKPVEYQMRQPGQKLPDRSELSDPEGCGTWETGPDGEPKDPLAEHALHPLGRPNQRRGLHVRHRELGWTARRK